jgi:lysyl-tRNA synthetase class 2
MMQALVATPPADRTSYAQAFRRYAGLCPHTAALEQLASAAALEHADRDELLNAILAARVEPKLGHDRPEIVFHYPASQASLAKTAVDADGHNVAERFELYYRGVELANGFHELSDAQEQRRRFEAVNVARVADGRPALPLPESLLAALASGLPDCTGCALGLDRLVMLAVGGTSIDEVLAIRRDV